MKKQKRYKHRVSWIENGKVNTSWFSNHGDAFNLYDELFMKGLPVYYARKISDVLSAYMFDHIKSDNGFAKVIKEISNKENKIREKVTVDE